MTTPYAVELVRGARTLTLTSGRYRVAADFVPPRQRLEVRIAAGTSANRFGGGRRAGEKGRDRAWGFGVHVVGESAAEIERGIADIQTFLNEAGDEDDPTYVRLWSVTDIAAAPSWGQGAIRLYEVLEGTASLSDLYSVEDARGYALPGCRVDLTIKPYARGRPQILCEALGGILEDRFGSATGRSRGLIVPGAMTNKMTNPVFGHSTPLNDWTAGAAITATANRDRRFIIPGARASAKLVCDSGAGTTYTQSINVGNTDAHVFYAIVKLEDGGAVSSSQVSLRYAGNSLSTTYTHLGDGFYFLRATATGVASAQNTGVIVSADTTIYLCYFGCTSSGFGVVWGDLLGSSWSGTAHASTSTRAAGRCRIPLDETIFNRQQGTIRVVWMSDQANTAYSADAHLWNATDLRAAFIAASDVWELHDGTNALQTAATTFAAGVPVVLHFVWGNSGRAIYINGALSNSTATFTPPAQPTDLYVGSDTGAANHIGGTFLGFDIWQQPLSATEVLNDYNNVAPLAADRERVSAIPWLWTKDGDNVVDNHDDSGEDNWCAIGGVPGSINAETRIHGSLSESWATIDQLWLSRFDQESFAAPGGLFKDLSGTVDGNSSGGEYETQSISTSEGGFTALSLTYSMVDEISGRDFYMFCRLKDAGSNLNIAAMWALGAGNVLVANAYKAISTTTTMRLFKTDAHSLPEPGVLFLPEQGKTAGLIFGLKAKRSSGGAANVDCDWYAIVPRPVVSIGDTVQSTESAFIYEGRRAVAGTNADELLPVRGDIVDLVPERINVLYAFMGLINSGNPVISYTLTYSQVYVTPRYALI